MTFGYEIHCELVNRFCRCMSGLHHNHATKSKVCNHGDLQDGHVHSSCRCDYLHLFVDGAVADRLVNFDFLEEGYGSGFARTSTPESFKGGTEVLKKRVGVMRFFLADDIFKL